MNAVNKRRNVYIKDMNRINKRRIHCQFGEPFAVTLH